MSREAQLSMATRQETEQSIAPLPMVPKPTLTNAGYIVAPLYDALFFLFSPLLALGLGLVVFSSSWFEGRVHLEALRPSYAPKWIFLFGAMFTKAHLAIVFFRSHGNPSIYRLHPIRFRLVPIALLVAILTSKWLFVIALVLAIWWDVYHTAAQTFGLGRIYDQRHGNLPSQGRTLDLVFNVVLYAGPLFAGLSLLHHLDSFQEFNLVHSSFFTAIPGEVMAHSNPVRIAAAALTLAVALVYGIEMRSLQRKGYRLPPQKLALLGSTAICSVWAWGFMRPAEALFVVNFFHALQYFGIVWWSEGKTIKQLFQLDRLRLARAVGIFLLVVPAFVYGFWAVVLPGELGNAILAIGLVVSLMHFWYDGFIWSVRKRQV